MKRTFAITVELWSPVGLIRPIRARVVPGSRDLLRGKCITNVEEARLKVERILANRYPLVDLQITWTGRTA